MSEVGLTLRDVFLKGGDLFPGTIPIPDPEPDADCENREEVPSLADDVVDDEDTEEELEGCGKTGHRGQCGHCEECVTYGDMKYHESIDRMIEREG